MVFRTWVLVGCAGIVFLIGTVVRSADEPTANVDLPKNACPVCGAHLAVGKLDYRDLERELEVRQLVPQHVQVKAELRRVQETLAAVKQSQKVIEDIPESWKKLAESPASMNSANDEINDLKFKMGEAKSPDSVKAAKERVDELEKRSAAVARYRDAKSIQVQIKMLESQIQELTVTERKQFEQLETLQAEIDASYLKKSQEK